MTPFRILLFQTGLYFDVRVQLRAYTMFLLVFGFLLSTGAMAATVNYAECRRDGITRLVEQSPTGMPCQVLYYKPHEGQSSSRLWYAQSEPNFCRKKRDAFLIKLETIQRCDCSPDGLSQNRQMWEDQVASLADQVNNENADEASEMFETLSTADALAEGLAITTREHVPVTDITDTEAEGRSISNSRNPFAADRSTGIASSGNDDVIDLADFKTIIPSGFYFYDMAGSRALKRGDCPADGHFLWNTRDSDRPVFEMGLVSEFPGASEVLSVQHDANGTIRLLTHSMTLQPRRQSTMATAGDPVIDGIELEIRQTLNDSAQTTICRYLRG